MPHFHLSENLHTNCVTFILTLLQTKDDYRAPSLVRKEDVTIIVPVLNEEEAIVPIVKELLGAGYSRILVVDGYSVDNTLAMARSLGVRVVQQHGSGKAGALKTAFEMVETPYLLVMDGDYTYCAGDIEKFLHFADKYDQIFGRRMLGKENIPRLNRFGNWVINTMLGIIYGGTISDVCTGMYMMKTDVARNLTLNSKGFDVEVEIAIQNLYNGSVTEVPINYRKRMGIAKLTRFDGVHILWRILRMSLTYNPVFILASIGSTLGLPGGLILLREFYLRLIYGDTGWSIGYVWLGLILFITGLQCLTISILTLLSKRQENRIIKYIKDLQR